MVAFTHKQNVGTFVFGIWQSEYGRFVMGWNYRKRIKIFPGVHLNVSKRGVSTSFGIRGASVTVGKNGTYLNTGIPGTGIYNRQKLSKTNRRLQFNNSVRPANIGCLAHSGLWLSWSILIFIMLIVFTQSIFLGIIFTGVVILAKMYTRTKSASKSTNQKDIPISTTKINERGTNVMKNYNTPSFISKEYFTNVTREVEKIVSFYEELCNDDGFLNIINENEGLKIIQDGREANTKEKIRALFLVDMTRCFFDLGHELDIRSKEGFGLLYFFSRVHGLTKFEYDALPILRNGDLCKSGTDFIKQIRYFSETNLITDEIFLISQALCDYDMNRRKQYLVMLYRYTSLTAKADGIVSEKEAEWLSQILSLSTKSTVGGNVVVSNESNTNTVSEDKQSKITRNPPAIALNALIGLSSVKEEVEALTNFIKIQQVREQRGLKISSISYHCVFTGNPGTGKTTVARIVADIYKSLGILAKGHLVETDRSGLVAEYVGQTAVKTNKIIDTALDGVLFIDEAYSLIADSQNDYGREAIATLLKRMEDNRNRLIVILAGYSVEMQKFIESNPGLQSRFNRYIDFPDYSAEELYQIFELYMKQFDYVLSENAIIPLKEYLKKAVANKGKNWGNARFIRNLFEKTIERQANRLSREADLTEEKLSEMCITDIDM
jgi:AAA+ superfamily predicted ATPase